jgi:stage V sporulation protein G
MKVTEIRVKIVEDRSDKLQAFCSITIDSGFVVRDLKIIEGNRGAFVAMPSRKLTDRCHKCSGKNHLRASYCNDCGARLNGDRADRDPRGRAKLHADIAHPINSATRDALHRLILDAYKAEVERSKMPGYVPQKLYEDEDFADDYDHYVETQRPGAAAGSGSEAAGDHRPPLADRGASRTGEDGFASGIM